MNKKEEATFRYERQFSFKENYALPKGDAMDAIRRAECRESWEQFLEGFLHKLTRGKKFYIEFEYRELPDNIAEIRGIASEAKGWIPCSSGKMPKEHEIPEFHESRSDDVQITIEFLYGGDRKTTIGHTTNGEWKIDQCFTLKAKVVAWQPLSQPYQPYGEETSKI